MREREIAAIQAKRAGIKVLEGLWHGAKSKIGEVITNQIMQTQMMDNVLNELHAELLKNPQYNRLKLKLKAKMARIYTFYGEVSQPTQIINDKVNLLFVCKFDGAHVHLIRDVRLVQSLSHAVIWSLGARLFRLRPVLPFLSEINRTLGYQR